MSFERMPASMGTEPAPPAAAEGATDASRAALRLQVLATEHWGLLATRAVAWNESFTRAGMFLSTLSGAIVALALVAQATAFGSGFFVFALVVLPVVLFIGLATVVRMGKTNYTDALCVIGMNRIRQAYLQVTPEVEPFLVMSPHDDLDSVNLSMGYAPGTSIIAGVVISTPFVTSTINSVLGGVIGAIIAQQSGLASSWAIAAGMVGFFLVFGLQGLIAYRDISSGVAKYRPKFPAPPAESDPR